MNYATNINDRDMKTACNLLSLYGRAKFEHVIHEIASAIASARHEGKLAGLEEACKEQCYECAEVGPSAFISSRDGYHKYEGGMRPQFMHGRTETENGRVCQAQLIRFYIRKLVRDSAPKTTGLVCDHGVSIYEPCNRDLCFGIVCLRPNGGSDVAR